MQPAHQDELRQHQFNLNRLEIDFLIGGLLDEWTVTAAADEVEYHHLPAVSARDFLSSRTNERFGQAGRKVEP